MAGEQRWIFSDQELQNTPSRKADVDPEKELNYRQQCANLIQDMGQKLQVYPMFFGDLKYTHVLVLVSCFQSYDIFPALASARVIPEPM